MSSSGNLAVGVLALGLGALGVFAWRNLRKLNTTGANPAPSSSGVLGTSPVLNPAAPKTPGDFARYDRTTQTVAPSSTQATRVGYHDPVYDAPAADVDVPRVDPYYSPFGVGA